MKSFEKLWDIISKVESKFWRWEGYIILNWIKHSWAVMVYFGFVIWESKYNTPFTFFEHVEIYALFGRTKWTQNLQLEDQNRIQGPGPNFPLVLAFCFNQINSHLFLFQLLVHTYHRLLINRPLLKLLYLTSSPSIQDRRTVFLTVEPNLNTIS